MVIDRLVLKSTFRHDGQNNNNNSKGTPNSEDGNQKDKNTAGPHGQPPFCVFPSRGRCRSGTNCPVVHVSKDGRTLGPERWSKSDEIKDPNNALLVSNMEKTHAKANLKCQKASQPRRQSIGQVTASWPTTFQRRIPVVTSHKKVCGTKGIPILRTSRTSALIAHSIKKIRHDTKRGHSTKSSAKKKKACANGHEPVLNLLEHV